MSSASTNPGNFANRPTEEVKAIASMGGKTSHGSHEDKENEPQEASHPPGRNADGTFTKGSEAAAAAGHLGGLHANGKTDEKIEEVPKSNTHTTHNTNRNPDGTFAKKSESPEPEEEASSHPPGRNADGTFVKGSSAAAEAGHIGGLHAAGKKDVNELEVQPEKSK